MNVRFNGENIFVDKEISLAQFIELNQIEGNIAFAINGEFIPRSNYTRVTVKPHDEIECVGAVQGG